MSKTFSRSAFDKLHKRIECLECGVKDISDFIGGGMENIYTTNSTIGANRVATITDTLTFKNISGEDNVIFDTSFIYGGQYTFGNTLYNNSFLYNGVFHKALSGGPSAPTYTGFTSLNDTQSNAVYTALRSYKFGEGRIDSSHPIVFGTSWNGGISSEGVEAMRIGTDQNVSIGFGSTSGQRFLVRGSGNTSATTLARFENLSGTDKFIINDDGQIGTGAGQVGSISASFGQYHQTTGFNFGFGFYPSNSSSAGVTIQMKGTTRTGLSIAHQGNPGGINTGISSVMTPNLSSTNIGIDGSGYNASNTNIGVKGRVSNTSVIGSSINAGIYGLNDPRLSHSGQGGLFVSIENNTGVVFTNVDLIGVEGHGLGGTNAGNSGVKSIGGKFLARNGNSNIALLVPDTNNDGVVVLGADDVNGTSMLQVTGDIEVLGIGNGYIVQSPDGTRWRITVDNTGAITTATA